MQDKVTLEQTLQEALTHSEVNHYAYALALSRQAQPTPLSVQLTLTLIHSQGHKWLEVLARQTTHHYELVFNLARHHLPALPVLIEMANYTKLAYEDAKAKATAMAEKIGRKVGKALYITNSNSNETVESIYYATEINNRKYNISVSFELL